MDSFILATAIAGTALLQYSLVSFAYRRKKKKSLAVPKISLTITEITMKKASVKVTWSPSLSTDITGYIISVVDETNTVELVNQTVSHAITEWTFEANQNTVVSASVLATDGTNNSEPTTSTLAIPDMEAPLPVSGVTMEIIGLVS